MASRRAVIRLTPGAAALACRASARPIPGSYPHPLAPLWCGAVQPQRRAPVTVQSVRWYSAAPDTKVWEFEDVRKIVESPTDTTLLIDVREPSEFEAGFIPTALNIPISSQPDALFLSPEDFEDRFGFPKPPLEKEVVFYCKAGVRSSAAAKLATRQGYGKVGEYRGSWLDWEKNGGASSKNPSGKGAPQSPPV